MHEREARAAAVFDHGTGRGAAVPCERDRPAAVAEGWETGRELKLRQARDRFLGALSAAATAVAVGALLLIVGYVAKQGASALNLDAITKTPAPVGATGGGFANAIVGTLIIVAIAGAIALPLGIGGGVYLAEFGGNRFGGLVRFVADILTGVPSIVIGILAYELVVVRMHRFSALAGGVALAALMLPPIARATEEAVRLVPPDLTDAALALGAPRWRAVSGVVVPAAVGGIVTGGVLAVARAAGETAPLLFTAFGNNFWNVSPTQPMAALPLQIYQYAISPYDDWHAQAWAAALVLIALVLVMSLLARLVTRQRGADRS